MACSGQSASVFVPLWILRGRERAGQLSQPSVARSSCVGLWVSCGPSLSVCLTAASLLTAPAGELLEHRELDLQAAHLAVEPAP
jgi:hypothetical protein